MLKVGYSDGAPDGAMLLLGAEDGDLEMVGDAVGTLVGALDGAALMLGAILAVGALVSRARR